MLTLLPHHQPIRRVSMIWSCPSLWTITVRLLTTPSRMGHLVLKELAHYNLLCLAKQKLSYSTYAKPPVSDLLWCQVTEIEYGLISNKLSCLIHLVSFLRFQVVYILFFCLSLGFFCNNKWNKNVFFVSVLICQSFRNCNIYIYICIYVYMYIYISIPYIYLIIYFPAQSNKYFQKLHKEKKLGSWKFVFSFLFFFNVIKKKLR